MKTMHKQTSRVGWVIPLSFLFLWATRPPLGPFLGPLGPFWTPLGPSKGKPFFLSFFFLWVFLSSPLGPRGPHGPLTKSQVTPPLFGPTCLGFFHKHGKSPDPPSLILLGAPWEGEEGRGLGEVSVYLNHRLSTPQGGWSAAVFFPLGHPMPYESGDCQYRRRRFGNERNESGRTMQDVIGVWEGVAMDTLKLHLGPPHPTPLRPAD